jgi:hypothetical protein
VSGRRADAPVFRQTPSGISLPLHLEPWGSAFVVFRRPLPENWVVSTVPAEPASAAGELLTASATAKITYADKRSEIITLPVPPPALVIPGPWTVEFKDGRGAPPVATFATLTSWSEHADPGIRHYSGTGIYRATVQIAAPPAAPRRAFLDLGRVADIARVYINGHDIGILCKPPFRADITALLKPGANTLEVHVANRWINRLIGDEAIPAGLDYQKKGVSKFTDGRLLALPDWLYEPAKRNENKRHSFSVWKHYDADSPLVPSGLLGPVSLEYLNELNPVP